VVAANLTVVAANLTVVAVTVAAGLMMVVDEDCRALHALGLGAGFHGSTSCPLTLLGGSESRGGSEMKDPSARRSRCRLSPSDLPVAPGEEELPAAPLPLSEEVGPQGEL
jgi:hypothetical protein